MFGASLFFEASALSDLQGGAKAWRAAASGAASVRPQLAPLWTSAALRNCQDKYVKDCYVSSTLAGTSDGRTAQ